MAIFTPGPAVGQVSGRVGGTVFSHNRGGAYMRNGVIPTASNTPAAILAKARVTAVSRQWASLTDDQQTAWKTWAQNNPVVNRLGSPTTLAGHMAYMQLNNRLTQAGDTNLTLPPVDPAPAPLLTFSLVADVSDDTCVLTFTGTPLGAGLKLWLNAAVVDGAGIKYFRNLLKLITISAAAQATGLDVKAALQDRFGSMIAGQVIHATAQVFDSASGLLSGPLYASTTIAT